MKNLILFSFTVIVLFSCSTQTVMVDYDRGQDFNQIKNYAVQVEAGSLGELDINRLKLAINQELSKKGMQESTASDAVIKIVPEEYISQEQNSSIGIGMGGGNHSFGTSIGIGIPINSEKLNQVYKVTMTTTEGRLIWEGRLDIKMPANASPETREMNIQKGVNKLFKKYPPK